MIATLTHFEGKPVVKMFDPPQYMTLEELGNWMLPYREDDPDYYSELVSVYVMLDKFAKRNMDENNDRRYRPPAWAANPDAVCSAD